MVAAPDGRLGFAPPAPAWLASAGTGDVLAGMIAALAGARAAGVRSGLRRRCGCMAARRRSPARQMIADDLAAAIPRRSRCCERTDRPHRGARRRRDAERPPCAVRRAGRCCCSTTARWRSGRITRSRHAAIFPNAAAASSSMPTTKPIAAISCRGWRARSPSTAWRPKSASRICRRRDQPPPGDAARDEGRASAP